MSADTWPPALKDWVAKCLGQMTDANRAEAQGELRQVIADAFTAKTLWTTDWPGVTLKSLSPKPIVTTSILKRKSAEMPAPTKSPIMSKKAKKQAMKQAAAVTDLNDQAALNRRAQRFQREHDLERSKSSGAMAYNSYSKQASSLPSHVYGHSRSFSPSNFAADDPEAVSGVLNWDRHTIVGTSREIFKDYLRLTSEPKSETIRPYTVLQQTFQELVQKWKQKTPYNWICSQLKSMRQDLTVQRIKNELTVKVYEMHARIALETGDMVEYNACQSMLRGLYDLGIPGKVEEFTAYRIMLLLHGLNRSELNLYVAQLTPEQKAGETVQYALAVQRALATGNYHRFFRLYERAPKMSGYIMDHFVVRERVKVLMLMTKSYRTVPLSFIQTELAFDNAAGARDFLIEIKAGFFTNPNDPPNELIFECKPAAAPLGQVFEEKYRKVQIKGRI